jgi:hypothetical protein
MSSNKSGPTKNKAKKLLLDAQRAAEKAARAAAVAALNAAEKAAIAAKKLKRDVESSTRDALDRNYNNQRPLAEENLRRLRGKHADATPAEIVLVLEKQYLTAGAKKNADSTAFIEDSALFILTMVEIYQPDFSRAPKVQRLVDQVVFVNSKPAKAAAEYGGIAVAFVFSRIPANAAKKIGAVLAKIKNAKFFRAALVAIPFLKKMGIDDWSNQAIGKTLVSSVKKILGPAPKTWPSPKTAPSKKPAATKTVVRKAVPKKKPAA